MVEDVTSVSQTKDVSILTARLSGVFCVSMKVDSKALDISKLQPGYASKWIAFHRNEVLASGATLQDVTRQLSKEQKEAKPLLFRIPSADVSLAPIGV